jgi:cytochrome c
VLSAKIISGGAGVWGPVPMLPHPQHTPEQTEAMVEYILTLPPAGGQALPPGFSGLFIAPGKPGKNAGGRLLLTASYTDLGANGLPPLTGEATLILHPRRIRAALCDDSHAISIAEVSTLHRARRICAQLGVGSHLVFHAVELADITRIDAEVSASTGHGGVLEIHADRPNGPLIGRVEVPVTGQWDEWRTVTIPVSDPGGVHDLYVVGGQHAGDAQQRFNLDVLEFRSEAK